MKLLKKWNAPVKPILTIVLTLLITLWLLTAVTKAGESVLVKIHDADTITFDVDLGWDGITVKNQTVRVLEFDAWEITKQRRTVGKITDKEIAKGKLALEDAKSIFAKATRIDVRMGKEGRDVYGRALVHITVDGVDYATKMKSLGHDRREQP